MSLSGAISPVTIIQSGLLALVCLYVVSQYLDVDDYLSSNSNCSSSSASSAHHTFQDDQDLVLTNLPPVCSALLSHSSGSNSFSTRELWSHNLQRILDASRHPNDHANAAGERNAAMLYHDLLPTYLQDGVKSRPRLREVKRMLDILEKRRYHPDKHRPLTILVLGGSVTEGRGCKEDAFFANGNNRQCAWPFRLQPFLNNLLGYDAVQVSNAASGGTGSGQGSRLIKYWMYPSAVLPDGPDIIINGYGMNDSFLWGALDFPEFERVNIKFQGILNAINSFVTTIYEAHPCIHPMIIYLDDYLGTHRQGNLIYDQMYNTVMSLVTKWYRLLAVSSADVVRRIVLADTSETMYTPKWILNGDRYKEEVHFGAGGHMLILWTLAYGMLDAVTTYCDEERWQLEQWATSANDTAATDTDMSSSPFAFNTHAKELVDNSLPPPLTNETMLEKISPEWSDLAKSRQEKCSDENQAKQFSGTPCVFAFIAGPEGYTSSKGKLEGYLRSFRTQVDGFECQDDMKDGWSRKLGYVATKTGASVTFEMKDIQRDVRYIMLDYLKSYGDKWANSQARFTASVMRKGEEAYKEVYQFTLDGFHDATASITYSTKEDIGETTMAKVGDNFRLRIELIGGTTFKIMGMMFCNR